MLEIKAVTEGKIEILFGTLNHLGFGFVWDLGFGIWDLNHMAKTCQVYGWARIDEA
jgi:hypothetical protein